MKMCLISVVSSEAILCSSVRDKMLVFGSPDIHDEEIEEVIDSMRTGWLGTGPKVARFEREFAAYKGISEKHVAAVNSCTSALHLSLLAADIGAGDEVITTPMTFAATVNSIIHSGATPVLADVNSVTMNIDPERIKACITEKTRAIIPVHMAGRPCNMDAIMDIAEKNNLVVIEDCAHAVEALWRGKKTGTIGDFGCFSFYATKNITTGEGGMILAREKKYIEKARILALHGLSKDAWNRFGDHGYKHYFVVECGYKYNMMDIQAAIGIHQLARVELSYQKRQNIWNQYQKSFKDLPVTCPADPEEGTRHALHLYTLLIDEAVCGVSRDKFLERMTQRNIGVGVHYMSLPEHPYYRDRFGWKPEDYPNAMRIGRQTVSLPLSPKLTQTDILNVIASVESSLVNG